MQSPAAAAAAARPIKIAIVDDSVVVRGLLSQWVRAEPDMELVVSASDGQQALDKIANVDADVCILDIEMPVMGGLEALPKLLQRRPDLRVIIASTLSSRGGDITMRALDMGASDYVTKPEATKLGGAAAYRDELLQKIRGLAARRRAMGVAPPITPRPAGPIRRQVRPRAVFVCSSTGGPPALRTFLSGLGSGWRTPVFIVQHMPAAFTKALAEHLAKTTGLRVVEAAHGGRVEDGVVYLAPGGFHLTVAGTSSLAATELDQGPEENYCRPAGDKLLRSAANVYGAEAVAVILTGMGHDGREGARALAAKGGLIMAQDEASSVVWGMPGAVAEAGLARLVRPVQGLAEAVRTLQEGGAI